jgi:Zn-finger nucleic acid-binding protein
MPLLMCPNDNASMQTINRNGVEFDMCPSCRGVWLDRGELEKLIEGARAAMSGDPSPQAAAQMQPRPQQGYGERGEHGERGEYGERGHQGQRRRRGFDLFDIFD